MAKRKIATAITNNNGIATVEYEGQGVGKLDLHGEVEGILQSEIYDVWDTLFYLTGTSDTGNWTTSTNVSIAYSDEGTHFTSIGTGGQQINLEVNGNRHSFDGTKDICFEFKLKHSNAMAIYLVDNSSSRRLILNSTVFNVWRTFKITYRPSTQQAEYSINDVAQTPIDMSSFNFTTIGLQLYDWQGDVDAWFKDLKVYNV